MRLIRRSKFPEAFGSELDKHVSEGLYPLHFCECGRDYYTAVADSEFLDASFLVEDAGRPVAVVECDITGRKLGRFRSPLEIRFRRDADYLVRKTAMRQAIAEFALLQTQHAIDAIEIATTPDTDPDGLAATSFLGAGVAASIVSFTEIDLSMSEKSIVDDYRSGHRQQMKWGEKNLALSFVDAANPDERLFERYRKFHAHVAGRQTRGDASWRAMFNFIKSGQGDLVIGFIGEDLVSASMVLDANGRAVYASGVYDRTRFDLPLGHYPLTAAIFRARRRGMKTFEVGQTFMSAENTKNAAIGFFKRGFSARLQLRHIWTIVPGH